MVYKTGLFEPFHTSTSLFLNLKAAHTTKNLTISYIHTQTWDALPQNPKDDRPIPIGRYGNNTASPASTTVELATVEAPVPMEEGTWAQGSLAAMAVVDFLVEVEGVVAEETADARRFRG